MMQKKRVKQPASLFVYDHFLFPKFEEKTLQSLGFKQFFFSEKKKTNKSKRYKKSTDNDSLKTGGQH